MKLTSKALQSRNMMGELQLHDCPEPSIETAANRILMCMDNPGFEFGDYNNMTEVDKKLVVIYWKEYDGLRPFKDWREFSAWFVPATNGDIITRAKRWLHEHNYIWIKPEVVSKARNQEARMRNAIKGT